MVCECGHQPWNHYTVTYPRYRQPCGVCLVCGASDPGPGKTCCLRRKVCQCRNFRNFQEEEDMSELTPSGVAAEAAVWGIVETEAKTRKDQAREWLAERMGPDLLAVSAVVNGETVGRASYVPGKTTAKVVDGAAFSEWVQKHYPGEVVTTVSVNPAFQSKLLGEVEEHGGVVVDGQGVVVDGVELHTSNGYVSVKKTSDARDKVAKMLTGGQLSIEGA